MSNADILKHISASAIVETFAHAATLVPVKELAHNGRFDWNALAESKVKVVTHCPADRGFIARCHALGILCFPYLTFYYGGDKLRYGTPSGTTPSYEILSDTYQGVKFGDHHDDWGEWDETGDQPKDWGFGNPTNTSD